jgi:hypothetical protein
VEVSVLLCDGEEAVDLVMEEEGFSLGGIRALD